MTPVFDLVWLFFLIASAAWGLATAVTRFVTLDPALPAAVRVRRSALLAAFPWLLPLVSTWAVALLAAAKRFDWITDHCAYHGPGHPHLCFEHLPAIGTGTLEWAVFGLFVLTCGGLGIRFALRGRRGRRRAAALASLARGRGRLRVIEDDAALAVATRAAAPMVLLSRGLVSRLARREKRIVVAHECVHLRRGDLLRNDLFEGLLLLHPPGQARRLRTVWRQALEERADDEVAGRFGPTDTASALLKVVRLQKARDLPGFAAAGADSARRIERLLISVETPTRWSLEWLLVAGLLATAAGVFLAHHALETFLGFVTG